MLRLFAITLTATEIGLLRELIEKGEQSISGNKNRKGLARLIKANYITEQPTNISTTLYAITDMGRAAVNAAIKK